LGTTVTNTNRILEEIMSRLNVGNACYQSAENPLSLLPVVLYGYETWSLSH